jgi:hypothetical protein
MNAHASHPFCVSKLRDAHAIAGRMMPPLPVPLQFIPHTLTKNIVPWFRRPLTTSSTPPPRSSTCLQARSTVPLFSGRAHACPNLFSAIYSCFRTADALVLHELMLTFYLACSEAQMARHQALVPSTHSALHLGMVTALASRLSLLTTARTRGVFVRIARQNDVLVTCFAPKTRTSHWRFFFPVKAAIRDPNPVVFLENELLYGTSFPISDEVGCVFQMPHDERSLCFGLQCRDT